MTKFMDKDFLLSTETAKWLYHEVAEKMPIIDYHCHISPKEIYENRKFENLSQVWLGGDHYKWRQMRSFGIDEKYVTGDSTDYEKFEAWSKTLPYLIGNPLYHWSHLELQRAFGIEEPLNEKTCKDIYDRANKVLENMPVREMMKHFNVKAICTTDDPIDDLKYQQLIKEDKDFDITVIPAFRPDKAVNIDKAGYVEYIGKLEEVSGVKIGSAKAVGEALVNRINYFKDNGCLCSDHALDYVCYVKPEEEIVERAFAKAMKGEKLTVEEVDAYKTYITLVCARRYTELNWVMQIHFGCIRNNNGPMFRQLGPDTGFDAINSKSEVQNLAPLLNELKENNALPKMIFYSLNPNDNTAIATIMGCFQGGVPGRLQLGSAWWFNDSRPGMRQQLTDLADLGVLGKFVGMLTDSRSFLSYTRHEYFRRILCEWIGEMVESGQYPDDKEYLSKIVADICFNNTNNYFGFGK